MAALTSFGIFHTAVSVVALVAGAVALIRDKEISWKNTVGKIYITGTIASCVTGFFIYHHGGFGKPHILGIITLIVLGIAMFAGAKSKPFGRLSPFIETVGYSMTFFFHFIPAITETTTRLPVDAPIASGPDDPLIQKAVGFCFLLFLIGATLQVRRIKMRSKITQFA